jgi:hypothetical protein
MRKRSLRRSFERRVRDRERPQVFAPAWHPTDVARPNTGICNIPPATDLRPTALIPASRGTGSLVDLLGQRSPHAAYGRSKGPKPELKNSNTEGILSL